MPVSTLHSPPTLAVLVDTAEHLAWDASGLTARAKAACANALQLVSASLLHREERSAWATILAQLPVDPDRMVVLCAYCHRVQGEDGWIPLPAGVEDELKKWTGVILSHGYCADCLQAHFSAPTPQS
jgi:hypothetical protein